MMDGFSVVAAGIAGGVIGGLLARLGGRGASDAQTRIEAKLQWLYQEQESLKTRVAELEASPRAAVAPAPMAPAQAAATPPVVDIAPTPVAAAAPEAGPTPIITPQPVPAAPPRAAAPRPAPPRPAPAPREPSGIEQAFAAAQAWLVGGNTVVRVGLLVLFIGLAFLARLGIEAGLIPVELRLAGIAGAAIALLAVGWRQRINRPGFGLTLQGGGVAVLYLTVFASLRLYSLIPPGLTLLMLIAIVLLAAALALLQNSAALAVIGTAGGFAAPILASTGQGSHVQLFGYYALLNVGVLLIAWRRGWRVLNLVGFLFTFGIAAAWGNRFYVPEFFSSTEPFLILFFAMYLAAAILYALNHAPNLRHYVDGTLVFGLPVVAFGLQAALVRDMPFGAAFSALAAGAVYILAARALAARGQATLRLLIESFVALGIAFLTLAIPLALDSRWTAAAWALEGAALVWVGLRQARQLPVAAGYLLQLAAGVAFAQAARTFGMGVEMPFDPAGPQALPGSPVLNAACMGAAMISLGGFITGWLGMKSERSWPLAKLAGLAMLVWGVAWWVGNGYTEIDAWLEGEAAAAAGLLFMAVSVALAALLADRLRWSELRLTMLLLFPAMLGAWWGVAQHEHHLLAGLGWAAWPAAFAALWFALARADEDLPDALLGAAHVGGVWLLALAGSYELMVRTNDWVMREAGNFGHYDDMAGWFDASQALIPAAMLALATRLGDATRWPFARWPSAYTVIAPAGLAVALGLWVLSFGNSAGNVAPLTYLPVLNPVDLVALGALGAAALWLRSVDAPRAAWVVLALLCFHAANLILLRGMHHLGGVPWGFGRMFDSAQVQTALSLFWSVLALILTVGASRRGARALWIVGAVLMGLVVVKLFLIDMASRGTITRVVSFIGAGVLMLVVGYFAPLPPRRGAHADSTENPA